MNGSYVPFLCFDPSTKMGWALWDCDKQAVSYGTWDLGKTGDHGEYLVTWIRKIEALLDEQGMRKDFRLCFAIEAPVPNATRSAAGTALANKWVGVLQYWCKLNGFAPPIEVPLQSWRSYFLRRTKPSALKGADATRWYKDEAIRVCNTMRLQPRNDNEADVLGILKYLKDGGQQAMARLQDQKKREKANTRAQRKLPLGEPA